jgi:DNA-binding transcriptional LysR family regulator
MNAVWRWSDLELILRLAETGSFSAAAHQMRVDATTVSRQLSRIEHRLGMKAFDRVDGRLLSTPVLEQALPKLFAMQEASDLARSTLQQSKSDMSARVRVSSLGLVFSYFLSPKLMDLHLAHPRLSVEFIPEDRNVSFERREADIAIRLGRPVEEDAKIRRLGHMDFGLYVPKYSNDTVRHHALPPIMRYDFDLDDLPEMQLLSRLRPKSQIAIRSSRLDILIPSALALGAEIVLPRYLGDKDPRFERAKEANETVEREIYLILHLERIKSASVRAVADWITECMKVLNLP